MSDQQQDSVVNTPATGGEHLQSHAELARTLRRPDAEAIAAEGRWAAELPGMPLVADARFGVAGAARAAAGAAIRRGPAEAAMVQP